MYLTGGFWSDYTEDKRSGYRDFCYMVIPKERVRPPIVSDGDWENVYQEIGRLGYRFRDAGHCDKYIIISPNKPIEPNDMKK